MFHLAMRNTAYPDQNWELNYKGAYRCGASWRWQMPEETKEESQEEFGWEDLRNHDDGTRDMGDPIEEAPEAPAPEAGEQAQPAETEPEAAPEPEAKADEPTEQAAETTEGEEEASKKELVYTLPGGKKVTQAELAGDPELLEKLVTQSNQYTDSQRIAKERKDKLEEVEAANRKLLDQFTAAEMQQRAMEQQQLPQQAPPQRPEGKVLEGVYGAHLDKLVTDGRLTTDQRSEFGNVLAEYMFDQQNTHNLITTVVAEGQAAINQLREQLQGDVVPDLERRQQQDVAYLAQQVQRGVSTRPGYEALENPDEWNRLQTFIAEKVNASPRDAEGRPTFDPQYNEDSMAQMYDAMTGAETRAALLALKARLEGADKETMSKTGGETSARAGTPPQKQPSPLTPEQEAMDFRDPTMATG